MSKVTWIDRIEAAHERKAKGEQAFTENDIYRARQWPTCACGEQSRSIPRYRDKNRDGNEKGTPKDGPLASLGSEFYDAVLENNPYRAAYVLMLIERRAGQVLVEALAEANRRRNKIKQTKKVRKAA